MLVLAHPFQKEFENRALKEALFDPSPRIGSGLGANFFDQLGDTVWDAVTGLNNALEGWITSAINTIKQLGETLALIVRACVGDVSWSEVLKSAGKVFQDIGAVVYYLNPFRAGYEWLKQAPLTAHAFNELDKFTGGMITNAVNVSDLVARAMRGDPISKTELVKDAILIIQVCAIIFSGGSYLIIGAMIGTMVGRQVCSKQTEAKDACMAAFQIAGAAVGGWGDSITAAASSEMTVAEENAWLQGDDAYSQFLDTSLEGHLTAAGQKYLTDQGIDLISQGAVRMCQKGHWSGSKECQIIGEVVNDYLKSPGDQEWDDFLASEIAKIGAEQLMMQWFPKNSRPYRAIQKKWQIRYVDAPSTTDVTASQGLNPKALLLMAAAAAAVLVGAGS